MSTVQPESRWKQRYAQIATHIEQLTLPTSVDTSQDREWCEVTIAGRRRRIRFHDYDEIYNIPGLYEALFYERLRCNSPQRVVGLLHELLREAGHSGKQLDALDVGAGNGIVGDELRAIGCRSVVGIDIIPQARDAARRDRPGVYDDYLVADLTDLDEKQEESLRKRRLNVLTVVAALGFSDIPPAAFLKALDVIATPAWLAFNIKEDFLEDTDPTGFSALVRTLREQRVIRLDAYRRYQHRCSTSGKPLYYVAVVGRKLQDLPDEVMEQFAAPAPDEGR